MRSMSRFLLVTAAVLGIAAGVALAQEPVPAPEPNPAPAEQTAEPVESTDTPPAPVEEQPAEEPPASATGTEPAAPPAPIDTTGAGSVAPAEQAEEAPVRESSPIGTWFMIAGLALGVGIVVRLTMRRRQDEEISIFDRSPAPRAPRPPIAHHP